MHTIKPLDEEAVIKAINECGTLITVEDHNILNGLGSAVSEVLAEYGKGKLKRIGIKDKFGESGPYDKLLVANGITVEEILKSAKALLK
jgi:transketolase